MLSYCQQNRNTVKLEAQAGERAIYFLIPAFPSTGGSLEGQVTVGEHRWSPEWGEEGSSVAALQKRRLICAEVSRVTAGKAERNCSRAKSLHTWKGWIVAEIGSPPSKCCLQHLPLHCAGPCLWWSIHSLTEPIVRWVFFVLLFAPLFIVLSQETDDLCEYRCGMEAVGFSCWPHFTWV